MLHIQCDGCKTWATADCTCPAEVTGYHLPACPFTDLGANVSCDCCPEDHSHDQAGTGCRPVTITVLPGSTRLQMATGG